MLKLSFLTVTATAMIAFTSMVFALDKSKVESGTTVYIVSPADGEVVTSPVKVIFGLAGAGVAPAGTNAPNSGHHHLIIDAPLPDTNAPVPADDNHKHFGKGQTEATIELAPGEHTLQLLLGDWLHIPHDTPVASKQMHDYGEVTSLSQTL